MWLLDANMDVHLTVVLAGFGISCDTVGNRGWKALSNSELLTTAVAAGFRCLLTRDQLFGESASRALKSFPGFAVVVVTFPSSAGRNTKRGSSQLGPLLLLNQFRGASSDGRLLDCEHEGMIAHLPGNPDFA